MLIKQKNQKKKFEIFFFTCFPQVYIYHFMYTGWVFLMFMMDFTYYLECSIVHNACTLCKDDAPKWYVKGSLCTVGFQKSLRIASVRSKTTLITDCLCGKWVDHPFCKMNTFFLMSLALSVPICRNFQSNGARWRSLKLWLLQWKSLLL